jgi:hypothetical protein
MMCRHLAGLGYEIDRDMLDKAMKSVGARRRPFRQHDGTMSEQ